MNYKENYKKWLNNDYFDAKTKEELLSIKNDEKEIEDRFYKNLEFGTGGLRGIIGAGDNRMNMYTVGKATQGLANYILKQGKTTEEGVAIAYDSRFMSPEFADIASLVLNANGIKTYVFESLRPTPELSFAVRELNCVAGIVVTASHNPPEYNGYKVYWSDGAQVPFPRDMEIITEVNNISKYEDVLTMDLKDAKEKGLYNTLGEEFDKKYYEQVKAQVVNKDLIEKVKDDLSIVYTPIHGTGNIPVMTVLKEVGFNNVHIVKEQENPDSNFTTVGYPNPEDPKVFKLAMELADKVNADIIVGTDPDADRVGAVVKNDKGEYVVLSGNMTGLIMTEYLLSAKKENGTLPKNGAIISTIVSTNMTKEIAKAYGCDYYETLTGFKYIGEKILNFEKDNSNEYIFGFEESFGSLAGTYARDKDAVVATLLLCEIAGYYKAKGKTLYDAVQELYAKYGFYKETIEAITLKGKDGAELISKIISNFRNNPPQEVNGSKIIEARDYKTGVRQDFVTNEETKLTLPESNVLYYTTEDGTWFCIRPSGTEPKIKIYFGIVEQSDEKADKKLSDVVKDVLNLFEEAKK